jgi:hypothetical protein
MQLFVLIAALHLVALMLALALLYHVFRTEPWGTGEDEDRPGGGGRPPAGPPRGGGPPLRDAIQSRVRLRGPGRIAAALPTATRRPAREPLAPRVPSAR